METVKDLFIAMKRYDDNPAIIAGEETITYKQLVERSTQLATGLGKVLEPGDKMAVWLPNSVEWIVTELAASLLGVTVVALNLRYKMHELSYILSHSNSKMLIFQPELEGYNYAAIVDQLVADKKEAFPSLTYIVSTGATPSNFNADTLDFASFFHEDDESAKQFPIERTEPQLINMLYTSGTTSNPKGVMLSQRSIIKHSYNAATYLGMHPKDVVVGALPFCGIFGLNTLFASLTTGACIVPIARYKPVDVLQKIEQHRCTVFVAVDGMVIPLFDREDLQYDVSSMRLGVAANSPIMGNSIFFNYRTSLF